MDLKVDCVGWWVSPVEIIFKMQLYGKFYIQIQAVGSITSQWRALDTFLVTQGTLESKGRDCVSGTV